MGSTNSTRRERDDGLAASKSAPGAYGTLARRKQFPGADFCSTLQGLTKDEWGSRCWDYLHKRAIRWHQRASGQQVLDEQRALQKIFEALPCEECSNHALRHYWSVIPDMTSNSSYHVWMFSFHNYVNTRLGKPHFSFENYRELYAAELRLNGL